MFILNIAIIALNTTGYSHQLCGITSCFGLHSHRLLLYLNSLGSHRCKIIHFWGGGQVSFKPFKFKIIFLTDLKTFQLAPYCLGPKETLDEFSEDPDRLLLSSIAEKVPLLQPTNLEDFYLTDLFAGDGCKAGDHCSRRLRPGLNKPDSKAGWLHAEDPARLPIHNI